MPGLDQNREFYGTAEAVPFHGAPRLTRTGEDARAYICAERLGLAGVILSACKGRASRRHPHDPIPERRNDENDELSNGHSPAVYGARQGMSKAFNLGSYDDVKKHAAAIYDRIRGIGGAVMPPPPPKGEGPWQQSRIELFAKWMTDGFQP